MAISTAKPLNLSTVQTEYGGSNPINMSEYYGKGNAPASSGAIDLWADFNGTANEIIFELQNPSFISASSGMGYFHVGAKNGQYNYGSPSPAADVGALSPDPGGSIMPAGHVTGSTITNWVLNGLYVQTFSASNRVHVEFRNGDDTTSVTDKDYWLNVPRWDVTSPPFSSLVISDSSAFNTTHTYTFSFVSSPSDNFKFGSYTTQVGWINPAADINVANAKINVLDPAFNGTGQCWIKLTP